MKNFERILLNLKIISKIKENCKIRQTKNGILDIEKVSFLNSLRRLRDGENRIKNIDEIRKVIDDIIDVCSDIIDSRLFSKNITKDLNNSFIVSQLKNDYSKKIKVLEFIYYDMRNVAPSLENLKNVYKSDEKICSNIDIIITKANIHANYLEEILTPKEFEFSDRQN